MLQNCPSTASIPLYLPPFRGSRGVEWDDSWSWVNWKTSVCVWNKPSRACRKRAKRMLCFSETRWKKIKEIRPSSMHTAQKLPVYLFKKKRQYFPCCSMRQLFRLQPFLSFCVPRISAPLANITRTISTWPLVAAKCKGVEASLVAMLMEAPKCKRKHTTSRWPAWKVLRDGKMTSWSLVVNFKKNVLGF